MDPVTALYKRGISGSTIKIIAILSMLIDHIGAVVVYRYIEHAYNQGTVVSGTVYDLYYLLRSIGRWGFPIFCFLLVEGFLHTRSTAKYALRLGIFALISEIPFNLAFSGQVFDPSYQNVFFTLFIGLLVMVCFRMVERTNLHIVFKILFSLLSLTAGYCIATFLCTDYNGIGVCCILVIYFFRNNKSLQLLAGSLAFMWEVPAPMAFIPIAFYNGKRGLKMKYFFYAFYPTHLLLLHFITYFLGLNQ